MSLMPTKQVEAIEFGLLSPDTIRKMSVARIITADTYDEDGLPIEAGGINGGLIQRGTYKQQVTSFFIKVKSIDDTIEIVEKNGGKLVFAKILIADFAYFAQINDYEGNLISLWEDKV